MPHQQPNRQNRSAPSSVQRFLHWTGVVLAGAGRLFTPGARGVYPPHADSLIVLGIALPGDIDIDALRRRLWWRGLGIIERDRQMIVGADVTAAVHKRRVRQARQFVIKQLRNAEVHGVVKRWEHPELAVREQGTGNGKARTQNQEPRTKNPKAKTGDLIQNPKYKIQNHGVFMVREVAVIGLGRFGTAVALALAEAGCAVVGIDRDRTLVQDLAEHLADVVQADATDEDALRQLGITDFDVVVVAIGADFESNLLITVSLKELGVQHVIAKALSPRQAAILHKVGADQVVLPEQEAGKRLANRLIAPDVTDALHNQTGVPAVELDVPDAWVGQTLTQLQLPRMHGVLVIAVRRAGDLLVTPDPLIPFESCDRIILVGAADRLRRFTQHVRHELHKA